MTTDVPMENHLCAINLSPRRALCCKKQPLVHAITLITSQHSEAKPARTSKTASQASDPTVMRDCSQLVCHRDCVTLKHSDCFPKNHIDNSR